MNRFENDAHPIEPVLRLLYAQYDQAIMQRHEYIGMELSELIIKVEYHVKLDLYPNS